MIINVSPLEVLAGVGVLLAIGWIWRSSVRRAKRVAAAARESAPLASLAGRVLFAAVLFAGAQWLLITHPGNPTLTAMVLGLPDLLAGYVLARALTVTTVHEPTHRRGGGDRR